MASNTAKGKKFKRHLEVVPEAQFEGNVRSFGDETPSDTRVKN